MEKPKALEEQNDDKDGPSSSDSDSASDEDTGNENDEGDQKAKDTKDQITEAMWNQGATNGFPTRGSKLSSRFNRCPKGALSEDYKQTPGREKKLQFRKRWAELEFTRYKEKKVRTSTDATEDRKIGTWKNMACVFWEKGYRKIEPTLDKIARKSALNYIAKCRKMGSAWNRVNRMSMDEEFYLVEESHIESFYEAWNVHTENYGDEEVDGDEEEIANIEVGKTEKAKKKGTPVAHDSESRDDSVSDVDDDDEDDKGSDREETNTAEKKRKTKDGNKTGKKKKVEKTEEKQEAKAMMETRKGKRKRRKVKEITMGPTDGKQTKEKNSKRKAGTTEKDCNEEEGKGASTEEKHDKPEKKVGKVDKVDDPEQGVNKRTTRSSLDQAIREAKEVQKEYEKNLAKYLAITGAIDGCEGIWSWLKPEMRAAFLAPLHAKKRDVDTEMSGFGRNFFSNDTKLLRRELSPAALETSCNTLRDQLGKTVASLAMELEVLLSMSNSRKKTHDVKKEKEATAAKTNQSVPEVKKDKNKGDKGKQK